MSVDVRQDQKEHIDGMSSGMSLLDRLEHAFKVATLDKKVLGVAYDPGAKNLGRIIVLRRNDECIGAAQVEDAIGDLIQHGGIRRPSIFVTKNRDNFKNAVLKGPDGSCSSTLTMISPVGLVMK